MRRISSRLLGLLILVHFGAVAAQEKPAGEEPPADVKLYQEISKIKDPAEQLNALRKFIADFPASKSVLSARYRILDALVKETPPKKEEILGQVQVIEATETWVGVHYDLAGRLMDVGYLPEAEEMARKGLNVDFATYKKKLLESEPGNKSDEAEVQGRFKTFQARVKATIGQILIKAGKTEEGEASLKEARASGFTPSAGQLFALASVAEKRGDETAALELMLQAAAAGPLKKDERERLHTQYLKKHGNLERLEKDLDSLYRKTYPIPFDPGTKETLPKRGGRRVLAEIFTGSGCPPCVAADLAFEAAMQKYDHDELVVLMYHVHIPRPDPLAGPLTDARRQYYGIGSVPTMRFDGVKEIKGGGPRTESQGAFKRIEPVVKERMVVPQEAKLELTAELRESQVRVAGNINKIAKKSPKLKLHLALVEEEVRYTGENGIRFHPMVVRSLAGEKGTGLPAAQGRFQHVFDLAQISTELKAYLDDYEINGRHGKITFSEKKHELNPKKLAVVAFIQDEADKGILQARMVEVQ
ncbi:MAG: hypothetical protein EHM61_22130 [Acidobacteria bacterium]|nr:MAG: hypothetical protein EHM61_22130 [Acidobacteriota bacterium]